MSDIISFRTPSGDDMVIVSAAEYARLVEAAEMAEDIAAFDEGKRKLASGEEELVPSEVADRLIAGDSAVRVWREYRGLTIKELAGKAGVAAPYVSQIEAGKRDGTVDTLGKIARALDVTIDDLV